MELTISEAKKLIKTVVEAPEDEKITLMMVGIPGIGKTEIIEQIGKETGSKVINLRTSLLDSTDLTGIPDPETREYVTKLLPKEDEKAIIFFDEVNRGHISSIQATFKIIEGRGSVAYKGSPLHTIVVAVNPQTDADTLELLGEAFLARVHVIKVKADLDDWVVWAKENMVSDEIIRFLIANPKFFVATNTIENLMEFKQVPNPRSWVKASKAVKIYGRAGLKKKMSEEVEGSVGPEAAAAFESFLIDPEPPVCYKEIINGFEKVKSRFVKHQEKAKNKALAACYDFAFSVTISDMKKHVKNISEFMTSIKDEEVIISTIKKMVNRDLKLLDTMALEMPEFFDKHIKELNEIQEEIKKIKGE